MRRLYLNSFRVASNEISFRSSTVYLKENKTSSKKRRPPFWRQRGRSNKTTYHINTNPYAIEPIKRTVRRKKNSAKDTVLVVPSFRT